MKIGDVAKQLNMPTSTIRYYEKRGLIPKPNRVSGKREFEKSTLSILRFIQLCQSAGFSINEISNLIGQFAEKKQNTGICHASVTKKQKDIQHQINELKQINAVLGEMTKCRCHSMEQCLDFALQRK